MEHTYEDGGVGAAGACRTGDFLEQRVDPGHTLLHAIVGPSPGFRAHELAKALDDGLQGRWIEAAVSSHLGGGQPVAVAQAQDCQGQGIASNLDGLAPGLVHSGQATFLGLGPPVGMLEHAPEIVRHQPSGPWSHIRRRQPRGQGEHDVLADFVDESVHHADASLVELPGQLDSDHLPQPPRIGGNARHGEPWCGLVEGGTSMGGGPKRGPRTASGEVPHCTP